jgi:hypothetical protein
VQQLLQLIAKFSLSLGSCKELVANGFLLLLEFLSLLFIELFQCLLFLLFLFGFDLLSLLSSLLVVRVVHDLVDSHLGILLELVIQVLLSVSKLSIDGLLCSLGFLLNLLLVLLLLQSLSAFQSLLECTVQFLLLSLPISIHHVNEAVQIFLLVLK